MAWKRRQSHDELLQSACFDSISHMSIPLEDNFNDILGKAIRGRKLNTRELAERTDVLPEQVQALTEGVFDETLTRKLAPALGLNANALIAIGKREYRPAPIDVEGLLQFNTPFDDMTVNSYLIWDPASRAAAAFDTGSDCSGMLAAAAERKLSITTILLTHTHGDHIFDLDRLRSKTGAPAFVSDREPVDGAEPFTAGATFRVGELQIETRLTWGHSKGGVTYVVNGLSRPIAVVGDAIFAGSMGGGTVSYSDALQTNRAEILTLPEETVLCPGHGPLTTVEEERRHNPFFAA
jgi:glyoxylase-like metal-dependent hydrolase (beta-lactamase superfamily II)